MVLQPPTEKQQQYAIAIARELGIELPEDALTNYAACSSFLDAHKADYANRKSEKAEAQAASFRAWANGDLIVDPRLREIIRDAKTVGAALFRRNEYEKNQQTNPANRVAPQATPASTLLGYWHDGLVRAAFDNLGKLPTLLDGPPMAPSEVEHALLNRTCKNLTANVGEAPVRHLVLRLDAPAGSSASNRRVQEPIALAVLPLCAIFETSASATEKQNPSLAYHWQRPPKELPLFNHRLLGEEADIDGLMLDRPNALTELLNDALTDASPVSTEADLAEWLHFFDVCFDVLTGGNGGVAGWADRFIRQRDSYPRVRSRTPALVLVDGGAVAGVTKQIRSCYEQLLADSDTLASARLSLLRRIASPARPEAKNYDASTEACRIEHVSRYLGHMDSRRDDGGRKAFPLDAAQRDALIAMATVIEGGLLAVNGPPGTGKTSLMRAVIASEWIKPLVSQEEVPDCPVILACAATNQAVTNIISSFNEVPATGLFDEHGEKLAGTAVTPAARWLPYLSSYGWFAPASLREDRQAELSAYQVITRDRADKPWQFHYASERWGELTTARAETAFLSCAREYYQRDLTLKDAALRLRTDVQRTAKHCAELEKAIGAWFKTLELLVKRPWLPTHIGEYEACLRKNTVWDDEQGARKTLEKSISALRQQLRDLQEFSTQMVALTRTSLFARLKRAIQTFFVRQTENERWDELRRALRRYDVSVPDGEPTLESWQAVIQARVVSLQDQLGERLTQYKLQNDAMESIRQQLTDLSTKRDEHVSALNQARAAQERVYKVVAQLARDGIESIFTLLSEGLSNAYHGTDDNITGVDYQARLLKAIQDWLDVHVRPSMFHLTARYWEARHLLHRKQLEQRLANDPTIQPASEDRLRELAMLAPVFVVTSYSAPKLMRRAITSLDDFDVPYLFGMAELLIVDEAGQGTSEIGACAFAFAKRAIVVGDVRQLEPVWSFEDSADRLLAAKHGLQSLSSERKSADGYESLRQEGVLLASGTVMRMAQCATAWADARFPDTSGLTLTNHYRCRAPIIEICNSMVYQGALKVVPESTEPKREWRPPLGFLVVQGNSTQIAGGSRCNYAEAERIARWIKEQRPSLIAHYNRERSGDKSPLDLPDLIAVLTPFKGQIAVLRKAIASALGENPRDPQALANRMVVGTVHSLQGSEKPIVLFSMVESAKPAEPQFYDKGPNLINVAVSRAKEMFIVALDQNAVDYARRLTEERLCKPSDHLWFNIVRNGQRLDSRRVVLIESPNKRDHIEAALGQGLELEVIATVGHLTELDSSQEWDPLTAAEPRWASLSENELTIYQRLATLWPDLEALYIATDPDAEGECIAWHFLNRVQEHLPKQTDDTATGNGHRMPAVKRMRFYAITQEAICEAYESAGEGLDAGMVKSALARTLLDQIIARHYPAKLGITKPNTFHAGIGRVQLGILDIVNKAHCADPKFALRVDVPVETSQTLRFFATTRTAEGPAPITWMSLDEASAAARQIAALQEPRMSWDARVQQLPDYPAINTAQFLMIALRETKLTPTEIMNALQALYEGRRSHGPRKGA